MSPTGDDDGEGGRVPRKQDEQERAEQAEREEEAEVGRLGNQAAAEMAGLGARGAEVGTQRGDPDDVETIEIPGGGDGAQAADPPDVEAVLLGDAKAVPPPRRVAPAFDAATWSSEPDPPVARLQAVRAATPRPPAPTHPLDPGLFGASDGAEAFVRAVRSLAPARGPAAEALAGRRSLGAVDARRATLRAARLAVAQAVLADHPDGAAAAARCRLVALTTLADRLEHQVSVRGPRVPEAKGLARLAPSPKDAAAAAAPEAVDDAATRRARAFLHDALAPRSSAVYRAAQPARDGLAPALDRSARDAVAHRGLALYREALRLRVRAAGLARAVAAVVPAADRDGLIRLLTGLDRATRRVLVGLRDLGRRLHGDPPLGLGAAHHQLHQLAGLVEGTADVLVDELAKRLGAHAPADVAPLAASPTADALAEALGATAFGASLGPGPWDALPIVVAWRVMASEGPPEAWAAAAEAVFAAGAPGAWGLVASGG